jgi:hypothetical protein
MEESQTCQCVCGGGEQGEVVQANGRNDLIGGSEKKSHERYLTISQQNVVLGRFAAKLPIGKSWKKQKFIRGVGGTVHNQNL